METLLLLNPSSTFTILSEEFRSTKISLPFSIKVIFFINFVFNKHIIIDESNNLSIIGGE